MYYLLRSMLGLALVAALIVTPDHLRAETPGPLLSLTDLSGERRSTDELGGRIAVVNFWATWCVPCLAELPMLAQVAREYGAADVVFVGVSTDEADARATIPEILAPMGPEFPVWVGATTEHMQRLGLGSALPATVILDREGAVAHRILGVVDEADLRAKLDLLVGRAAVVSAAEVPVAGPGSAEAADGDASTPGVAEQAHRHDNADGLEHVHDDDGDDGSLAVASLVPS